MPVPDRAYVLSQCEFLKSCKEHPPDPETKHWELMVQTLAFIDPEVIHQYCSQLDGYDYDGYKQAIDGILKLNMGPHTCKSIDEKTYGLHCDECPHQNKCISPYSIKSSDFLETEFVGFYHESINKRGQITRGKPAYEELVKYYNKTHEFLSLSDSGRIYTYNNKYWETTYVNEMKNFAQKHFNPPATKSMRSEFVDLIRCTNLRQREWFAESTEGFVNFGNGIYSIAEDVTQAHSSDYGFTYILPYEIDRTAECPIFDKFMHTVTCGNADLEQILLEYMGYALSNDRCWIHKCLILTGTGSNGKSTFIKTLKQVAGHENVSEKSLQELNDPQNRSTLDGALFHIAEEAGVDSLAKSAVFKRMISGDGITIKHLYEQPYTINNKCKLIISCNELPKSGDKTDGLYRRMLIVPFLAKFTDKTADLMIQEKLNMELPGIFNKIIDGYNRLRTNKLFTQSNVVDEMLDDYREENDNLIYWRNERIEQIDPTDIDDFNTFYIKKDDLYTDYKEFIKDGMGKPLSRIQFFRQIKRVLHNTREERKSFHTYTNGVKSMDFKRHRVFCGLRYQDDADIK